MEDREIVRRALDDVDAATRTIRERLALEPVSRAVLVAYLYALLKVVEGLSTLAGLEEYLRVRLFRGDAKWRQN